MLHITSGSNDPIYYNVGSDTDRTRKMAENLGVVAAVLYQVPNQPLDMVEIDGIKEKCRKLNFEPERHCQYFLSVPRRYLRRWPLWRWYFSTLLAWIYRQLWKRDRRLYGTGTNGNDEIRSEGTWSRDRVRVRENWQLSDKSRPNRSIKAWLDHMVDCCCWLWKVSWSIKTFSLSTLFQGWFYGSSIFRPTEYGGEYACSLSFFKWLHLGLFWLLLCWDNQVPRQPSCKC